MVQVNAWGPLSVASIFERQVMCEFYQFVYNECSVFQLVWFKCLFGVFSYANLFVYSWFACLQIIYVDINCCFIF